MDIQYFGEPTRCQVVRISPRPLPHRNASKCIKTHDPGAVDFPRSAAGGRAQRPAAGCTKTRQLSGAGRRGGDCEFRRFAAASPIPSPSPLVATENGVQPAGRARGRAASTRAVCNRRAATNARAPPCRFALARPPAACRPTAPARVRHRDLVHAPAAAGATRTSSNSSAPAWRSPRASAARQPQLEYGAATWCAPGRNRRRAHQLDQLGAGLALASRQRRPTAPARVRRRDLVRTRPRPAPRAPARPARRRPDARLASTPPDSPSSCTAPRPGACPRRGRRHAPQLDQLSAGLAIASRQHRATAPA